MMASILKELHNFWNFLSGFLKLNRLGVEFFQKLLIAVLIFVVFYLVSIVVKKIIIALVKKTHAKVYIFNLLANLVKIGVILLGLITALGTVGVDVSAIVASVGLTGFALSFAFKDFLSNVLAGIMIFMYHPYKVGNKILISGVTGEVIEINLRYTVVNKEDSKALIPNSSILSNTLTILD